MRALVLLSAVVFLACSEDAPPGEPSGLTTGNAGQAGASQAGLGGSAGAAAGQGGTGTAGAPVEQGGQAGQETGGGGQDAGGSDAGQGGESGQGGAAGATVKTPVELGCSFAQECLDGRDGYKCPSAAEPDGCVRLTSGGSVTWCCGTPKPATCEPVLAGGATKDKARDLDTIGTVSLPSKSVGWLSSIVANGVLPSANVTVKTTATPLGSPIRVCIGYTCADGSDGVKACVFGQKTTDGITLCCVDGDSATTGDAPKVSPSCPNSGDRTAYLRLTSKADTCVDVRQVAFASSSAPAP